MSTKNRKKNKRKLITRGHGNEPTVIEFNLSKAVLLCITIGVIITTITTVKVITTIIGAKKNDVLADDGTSEEHAVYVQSSDGIQVPVPKGYVASQIPGETSVNGGFVIYEDNYNGQSIDWNSILGTNSLSLNSLDASSQTSETTSSSTNGASADEITDTVLNESEEAEEINEEETELDQTTSNETISNDNKEDGTESADEQKETIETEGTRETETTEGTEITDNNENVDENTDNSDFVNDEKITEQEEEQTDETAEEQDNNNEQEELKDEEQINNREDNQEQEEQQETSQPVKVPNSANTVLANENSIQLYANSTQQDINIFNQQDINIFNLQKSVNQYVWVPVSEENLSRIYGVDANGKLWGKLYNYSSTGRTANNWTETSGVMSITSSTSYREPALVSIYDKDSTLQTDLGGMTAYEFLSELEENFYATIKSIKEHGGFYIGRYETGGLSGTAVVRKMETDINNQTWYTMYEKTKELSGTNDNAITSMIWGSLWDETLQWLVDSGAKTSDGTQLTYELIDSDSTKWGNYIINSRFSYIPADATTPDETATKRWNTLIPTGSAEYTKVNNIYDLAGNVFDWTLEADSTVFRVRRGGSFEEHSSAAPAADRDSYILDVSDVGVGSRSALFIK